MKKILVLSLALLSADSLYAQKDKKDDKKNAANSSKGFTTTARGLEYKIVSNGAKGARKPVIGDQVEMHVHMHAGDSVIFDSRKMADNKPVPLTIAAPAFNGDPSEVFTLLSVGDSAVILLSADSMKKAGANFPWLKEGSKVEYDVVLVSAKSAAEVKAEETANAMKQNLIDDKVLQEYFKKNNLQPQKTASGLYYKIEKQGTGDNAKAGQSVSVNYTGKTMDGKPFDSNVDPAFNHVQPFAFPLGQKQVIAGWDEGVALFKKGTKGTLYIPSSLAYGKRGAGGSIPPDAVLIFDIEVTDIK